MTSISFFELLKKHQDPSYKDHDCPKHFDVDQFQIILTNHHDKKIK